MLRSKMLPAVLVAVFVLLMQDQHVTALTGNVCYYQQRHVAPRRTSCCLFGWGRRIVYYAYFTREQRCCDGWKATSDGACTLTA